MPSMAEINGRVEYYRDSGGAPAACLGRQDRRRVEFLEELPLWIHLARYSAALLTPLSPPPSLRLSAAEYIPVQ